MNDKEIKSAEISLSKYLYDYTKIANLKYNKVKFKLDLSLMPEEYNIKFTKR
jgi:uncharacterized membrane protein